MSLFESLWCPSVVSAVVVPAVNYLLTDNGTDNLTGDDGITLLIGD